MIHKGKAKKFLEDMAQFWEKKMIRTKEDKEYWASRQNARICREIKELLNHE